MPDTIGSALWLSLTDMLVVFAVLAFLMAICYAMRFCDRSKSDADCAVDTKVTASEAPQQVPAAVPAVTEQAVAVSQPVSVSSASPVVVTITWQNGNRPASKAS